MTYNVFSGTLNPTHSLTHCAGMQKTDIDLAPLVIGEVSRLSSYRRDRA